MKATDLRLWGALLLLVWLAAPYWPTTVDDVYISVGFAQQWAETGALTWVDGARVEGYSNFLWVALLALATRIGTDPGLLAQLLALAAAGGVLAVLHTRLPRSGPGTLALLATAGLAPLSYWAVVGMETTLYALLLVLGWSTVAEAADRRDTGAWAAGVGWLALASLTRLEGIGHLGLALGLRALLPRRATRADLAAGAVVAGWLAYHGARVAWFGAVLPTPVLVKIGGQDWGTAGLVQAAGALSLGTGALALCAGLAWPGRRTATLAALPVLVQGAVLVRANGDWMGHGRLVLPGLLAAAAVLAGAPAARAGWPRWVAGVGLAVAGGLWMPGAEGPFLSLRKRPTPTHYALGLDTPLAEDLSWIANHMPPHSEFLAIDAGMLSTVPDVRLVDLRGLVHRDLAVAASEQRSESLINQWRRQGSAPEWTRVATWTDGPPPPVPAWLVPEPAHGTEYGYGGGTIRWFGPPLSESVSPAVVRARWLALLRRYPNQPFVAWQAARALRASGHSALAEATFERAARRWPRHRFLDSYDLATFWAKTPAPLDYQGAGLHRIDGNSPLLSVRLEADFVYRMVVRAGEVSMVESTPKGVCSIAWEADNAFVVGPNCQESIVVQSRSGLTLQTAIEEREAG